MPEADQSRVANYNTSPYLWRDWNPPRPLHVVNGHVCMKGEGALARFRDDGHAKSVLEEAGFVAAADGTYSRPAKT